MPRPAVDVETAYEQVPVRCKDWTLLGIKSLGQCYYVLVPRARSLASSRHWEMCATAVHLVVH